MLSVSKTFLLEFGGDSESFSVERIGSDGSVVRYQGTREDFDPREFEDFSKESTPREGLGGSILRKITSAIPPTTNPNPQINLGIRG